MVRLKRLCKRLAIGLAILVGLLLVVNAGYSWWIGRQLQQRLATLRAAGEPTSFAELAPKPIPPEKDAAAQLAKLAPELKALAKEQWHFLGKTPLGKAFEERQEKGLSPTPEQVDAMREILAKYEDLPRKLQQVADCPGYASRIDYSVGYPQMMEVLMEPCNDARIPARILRWRITMQLAEDKIGEAVQTGLTILRLARLYEGEPALVNGLMAIAMRGYGIDGINRALRAGPILAELRQQLDAELARQDDPQWIVRMMKTERAVNQSLSGGMVAEGWWVPWLGKSLQLDMLDYYDRLLPVMARPWHESYSQVAHLDNITHRSPVSGTLIQSLIPAIQSTLDAVYRDVAMLRCMRIVNGLTAYEQKNGHPPADLNALDLPAAAMIDPFSGQPLKLKQTDQGPIVYTVFKNGTDDGGTFKDQLDWGLAPAGYPGAE